MSDKFFGSLQGRATQASTKTTIDLDATRADISVGGDGRGGDIKLADDAGVLRIRLDAGGAESVPEAVAQNAPPVAVYIGADGASGKLSLRNGIGKEICRIGPDKGVKVVVTDSHPALEAQAQSERVVSYGALGTVAYEDVPAGTSAGVYGRSDAVGLGAGVFGYGFVGVMGIGPENDRESFGVIGSSKHGDGVIGASETGTGIFGRCDAEPGPDGDGYAGDFMGSVTISDDLFVGGIKSFRIDHPLDPANKYLVHSCVESGERINVYTGNVVLDAQGEGWVQLPDWFESLNSDFRYQLTPINESAPGLYVAQEVSGNRFKVAGGRAGLKISWQVTGTRQDAYSRAHPMRVEVDKRGAERGAYVHPIELGLPRDARINHDKGTKASRAAR